ncbi:DUF1353 domain-containing protein [Nocardia paucivorans]|uniref:DUF1353 domain-containing protein n=1 Tax=Nocardia paucivorans TaxID=114259 RepID=UPI00030D8F92|nr:DUF1353 domain-containing protein [Nocardia paucivorans]
MVFTNSLVVEEIDAQFWRLVQPLHYQGADREFTVPVGFRTDFASVPRPVTWLVPRYGVYTKAAILHDYLLKSGEVSTADADGIFRRALRECDVSVPRRRMMWAAVRFNSRLEGATAGDVVSFVITAVLSLLFLAIPVVVITVFLLLFWLVELVSWVITRAMPSIRTESPPRPEMRSA